jgi:anthranilate synthase component 1
MEDFLIEPIALPGAAGGALLHLHGHHPHRYPVLLESAASGTPQGRFSILLGAPGERLTLDLQGLRGPGSGSGFLQRLDSWWSSLRVHDTQARWPFSGGWFLFLGYELAGEVEPRLRLPPAPDGLIALAWRMRAAVVHDHSTGETVAATEREAVGFAAQVRADLRQTRPAARQRPVEFEFAEDDPERFRAAVRQALEHIAAGDVYQANLSRGWTGRVPAERTPAEIYDQLRRANPSPFAGIADLGDGLAILSSSPERLVSVRGQLIETRPIAGTRPRDPGGDAMTIDELIGHPKERAEHVMLIDLERNDLGRLCEAGTVEVDEMMCVESYAHVHHIVSNVRGRLRPEVTPAAVIRALFPGGTITGCPKVRCMQLIGELEGEGRGVYTGSMGYLGRDGSLDLNILIRTLSVRDGLATLRAGSGIVADSIPERELEETRAKARGVLRALAVQS